MAEPDDDDENEGQKSGKKQDSDGEKEDEFGFFEQKGVPYRITIHKMKDLIKAHIAEFVAMDPLQTVKLCDTWFDGDYNLVADVLKDH